MRLTSLWRLLLLSFLFVSLSEVTFAASPQSQEETGKAATASSWSPADDVIGRHLADWVKMGREAKAKNPPNPQTNPANSSNTVHVSAPAFVQAPFLALGGITAVGNQVAADVNNDGKIDLVLVGNNGAVEVFLNPGSFSNLGSLQPLAQNISAVSKNVAISQVVAKDVNGDGNIDLIGLDAKGNRIFVWLGKGDGTFAAETDYSVVPTSGASWTNPGALVVADFNGDGKPDIATIETTAKNATTGQTTITELTFLNQGNGVFSAGNEVDTVVVDSFEPGIGAADVVSLDGKTASGIAFVLTDSGAGGTPSPCTNCGTYVYVLKSNGNGSFTAPVKPTVPLLSSNGTAQIVATNLVTSTANRTGAGLPTTDLVLIAGDGAVYDAPISSVSNPTSAKILIGAPDNLGDSSTLFPSSPGAVPLPPNAGLVVADFDGDGYMDVLTTTAATAYMFSNNGNGTFTRPPVQVTGASAGHITAAVFDSSGYESFVWEDTLLNEVGYYQNLGATSSKLAGQFYAAPSIGGPSTNGGNYNAFAGNIRVQAVADINGDGLTDVIATDGSYVYRDSLAVHPGSDIVLGLNNGAALGANESQGFTFTTVASATALASLGVQNLFLEPITIPTSQGTSLLIASSTAALYTIAIDKKGNPGTPQALSWGTVTPVCGVYFADAGDLNGDGNTDIVVAYPGDWICTGKTPGQGNVLSGVFTFLGNGDGTFQPAKFTPIGSAMYKVKLINFTGKALDLVAIDNYTPSSSFGPAPATAAVYNTYVVPGNGDGTFTVSTATNVAANYIVSDAIVGDFNQDGLQDLTLTTDGYYNPSTKSVVPATAGVLQLPGNGNRTFGLGQLVDQEMYPATGQYADVNGDGTPDLIVAQYTGVGTNNLNVPAMEIFPNLGGGVFGPSYNAFVAPFNYVLEGSEKEFSAPIFIGSFSKAGSTDVLITNGYDSSLFVNEGMPALQVTASSSTPVQGSSVTLTASLLQDGSPVAGATGAVTFSLAGTTLGSSTLTGGTATLMVVPPVGSDLITATYQGDENHNPATGSTTVTVTAVAPAFTLSASPGSISVAAGATGTATLTLTSNASFSGAISFSCSGLPTEASCTVSPGTMSMGAGQTTTVTAVIATTPKNNSYQASIAASRILATAGISLASLLMFWRRRRNSAAWRALALSLCLIPLFGTLSGCSNNGSNKYAGTPAGTSTVTITATSGSISVSQAITLTVTQ